MLILPDARTHNIDWPALYLPEDHADIHTQNPQKDQIGRCAECEEQNDGSPARHQTLTLDQERYDVAQFKHHQKNERDAQQQRNAERKQRKRKQAVAGKSQHFLQRIL